MMLLLGILGGLVLLVVILLIYVIGVYNRLVAMRNDYQNAFAQIDVQLKRRHDLIPNLVETARGYISHERETLEAVIAARGRAVAAESRAAKSPGEGLLMQELAGAETGLSAALGRLLMIQENYPSLKADRTMMQLSEELSDTENRISGSRQGFNDTVMRYNVAREVFPANLIAGVFNFAPAQLLEATQAQAEREAPAVRF